MVSKKTCNSMYRELYEAIMAVVDNTARLDECYCTDVNKDNYMKTGDFKELCIFCRLRHVVAMSKRFFT